MLRLQKHLSEAKAILVKLKDSAQHNAEFYFQEGAIAEVEGDPVRAAKSYTKAIEVEPRHSGSLFRLGFLNDLQGNDHEAIGYYEKCLKYPPVGKGVLYNLGILYEDHDQYDKATECYRRLHKADPRDERAKLFVKDAEASLTQTYNPEDEQQSAVSKQVMETPITDFELSVRSRNCLKRMNIRTLGDLTRHRVATAHEQELQRNLAGRDPHHHEREGLPDPGSRWSKDGSTNSATARSRTSAPRSEGHAE
ncbi:MAG: tetratricopeptide repeat protein [Gemmataceae bacterium]